MIFVIFFTSLQPRVLSALDITSNCLDPESCFSGVSCSVICEVWPWSFLLLKFAQIYSRNWLKGAQVRSIPVHSVQIFAFPFVLPPVSHLGVKGLAGNDNGSDAIAHGVRNVRTLELLILWVHHLVLAAQVDPELETVGFLDTFSRKGREGWARREEMSKGKMDGDVAIKV